MRGSRQGSPQSVTFTGAAFTSNKDTAHQDPCTKRISPPVGCAVAAPLTPMLKAVAPTSPSADT